MPVIKFKGQGWTSNKPTTSLCRSCAEAHIMETTKHGEAITCNARRPFRVQGDVLNCNAYIKKQEGRSGMTLKEMYECAWDIEAKRSGEIGFRPPSKSERDKRANLDNWDNDWQREAQIDPLTVRKIEEGEVV